MPIAAALDLPATRWTVLGLMSGTSADGVDAALVELDPGGFVGGRPFLRLAAHRHEAYPADLRESVLAAAADRLAPSDLCILQRRLGEHHAGAAKACVAAAGAAPHFAALHGQTVQHRPEAGATLQLADPYLLAEALGRPVVWDLRRRDMALGGQGAPLVPKAELWLRGADRPWLALNLGGIANLAAWDGTRLHGFDAGPALSLLDLAASRWLGRPFDDEGRTATGSVREDLVDDWLRHPYFAAAPPKSTGRETFGEAWLDAEAATLEALDLPDRLATLAAFTARACAEAWQGHGAPLPAGTELLLSGGGARHGRLRAELARAFPDFAVADDVDLPAGSREAVSWALLGAAAALGLPGNAPEVTGASRGAALGSWTLP
jgi:anhydro-N-acetylmuramic acid kinase